MRKIKTEHAGAKNGGGFWGPRFSAKKFSRKQRRENEKREIREESDGTQELRKKMESQASEEDLERQAHTGAGSPLEKGEGVMSDSPKEVHAQYLVALSERDAAIERAEQYRKAIVSMVNILGAPRACPACKCEGCAVEMIEACQEGLIALGDLEPIEYVPDPTGEFDIVAKEPIPDPLDAWERYMKREFNVTPTPGWRDA